MAHESNEREEARDDIAQALRQVRLGSAAERLDSARLLIERATPTETATLERIRRRELDRYVQQAIDEAILASRDRSPRETAPRGPYDDHLEEQPWDDATYAQALRAATKSLTHELRRPLGFARHYSGQGDLVRTTGYLDRMNRLLDAMEQLVSFAEPGSSSEFDLTDLLREIADEHRQRFGVPVNVVAEPEMSVKKNRGSVELIVRNAMANACESVRAVDDAEPRPVVVTCGVSDRDVWVAILDHGVGIPTGFDPFTFAATRKNDHDGVGLALARRAALSIDGEITLGNRDDGGAAFRLTFPSEPA